MPITFLKRLVSPISVKVQRCLKGQITSDELATTFSMVLRRLKIRKPNTASIEVAETPINDMIDYLHERLEQKKRVSFFSCADRMRSISDVIGLFLAMLELSKKHAIYIMQAREFGDLNLERADVNGKVRKQI